MTSHSYPKTPDGRYFVVRARLWRASDPSLEPGLRAHIVSELMAARNEVGKAMRAGDHVAEAAARHLVDSPKIALGERGPVWWSDGSPDLNRHLARTGPYAAWYVSVNTAQEP